MEKISFVTNVTPDDVVRLKFFLPHAISVFDEFVDEFIIIVDEKREEGRIQKLHGSVQTGLNGIEGIEDIIRISEKIKVIYLDYSLVVSISLKYFNKRKIIRCQAGTPIFAFLFGIEMCNNAKVFRSDCDILFCNLGFIQKGIEMLSSVPIVQPPFLNRVSFNFSSRCFFINRALLANHLPFKHLKLDIFRRLHRVTFLRPVYLALEQIIENNIQQSNLPVKFLAPSSGKTMHINTRGEFLIPGFNSVVEGFAKNIIPQRQQMEEHNFINSFWN